MRAGVLWSGELHPGILPLSRYGDRVATILPSVLPATHLHVCREGSTDLSRIKNGIASAPGNVTYPTRNFALECYSQNKFEGPIISVGLCMSPCSTDYIFIPIPRKPGV